MLLKFSAGVFLFCAFLSSPGIAADRVALVVGMSKYKTLSKLNNPVLDAKAIASVLRANKFEVFEFSDLARADFLDALENFKAQSAKAEVALVYYAGHGLEVNGRNTIAPIDMEFSCEPKETRRAIELEKLFEAVQRTPQQIVLLDACRNDPFPACASRGGGGGGGFRSLEISSKGNRLLLANATLSGRLADDGPPGKNSPFASALLARFGEDARKPIRDILDLVARDVALSTNGAQTPEVTTRGGAPDVCLSPTDCRGSSAIASAAPKSAKDEASNKPAVAAGPSCSTTDADLGFQDAIRKNSLDSYREFLSRCPDDKRKETVLGLYGRLADGERWAKVLNEDTLSGYQQYQAAFPKGAYVDLAKKREKAIREAALTPAPSTTAPSAAPPNAVPSASSPVQDSITPRQVSKYLYGVDFSGDDLTGYLSGYSLETCAEACRVEGKCRAFTYNVQKSICILKAGFSKPTNFRFAVSGTIGSASVSSQSVLGSADLNPQSGVDFQGGDYSNQRNVSLQACQNSCAIDDQCRAFSYINSKRWCWLKSEVGLQQQNFDVISGRKN